MKKHKSSLKIFLDRDGTIIEHVHYIGSADDVQLIPNARAALEKLSSLGELVLVTNQSALDKNIITENQYYEVHNRMQDLVGKNYFSKTYCLTGNNKKPNTFASDNEEYKTGYMIGDNICDIEFGLKSNLKTILVLSGLGKNSLNKCNPHYVVNSLYDAVDIIQKEQNMTNEEFLIQHIQEDINVKTALLKNEGYINSVVAVAEMMTRCFEEGNKVLIMGNGGSAADAQHFSAELTSVLTQDVKRPGLPAIALTCDTSHMTASANDFGFEGTFARSTQALANAKDLVIGISTSGNSKNVLNAFSEAKNKGAITIGLIGTDKGTMYSTADFCISIPCEVTAHVQEAHVVTYHILCALVERNLGYRSLSKML